MIDTHCHLTFDDLGARPGGVAGVLSTARAHGVTGCITISTSTADCEQALAIAHAHDHVWCSSGVHPLYADEGPHDWDRVARVGLDKKCVAWGELGLDNHYPDPPHARQREVLDTQLDWIRRWHAEGTVHPVILHCREAFDDLIPILKSSGLDPTRMVFHCFTGQPGDMRKVLDLGSCVSFTGVVTYSNAKALRDAVRLVPDGRFMVETDAPYLSPDPHRGTRPCEPWMASVTAKSLAATRGVTLDALLDTVNRTTESFFGIRVPAPRAAS